MKSILDFALVFSRRYKEMVAMSGTQRKSNVQPISGREINNENDIEQVMYELSLLLSKKLTGQFQGKLFVQWYKKSPPKKINKG